MSKMNIISQSYSSRASNHPNLLARQLLKLMEEKQTNLCVSVDVTDKGSLLRISRLVGPYICMLKTHVDIITDFDQEMVQELLRLSQSYNFLIFEDRKFADIGNTVKHQYSSGIYKIADWSHLTNAHTVPGEGVITGLAEVGLPKRRALLLLAEMSSKGNLAKGDYTIETVQMARRNKDFVIGFISQRRLEGIGLDTDDPSSEDFLVISPGVGIDSSADSLGQRYRTPHEVVCESGADVIIVGRGIYGQTNPLGDPDDLILEQTLRYREAGWKAYLERINAA
ncbi:hypothetical protein CROQUDRAFT_656519 [Cronartium quercuum f. sp. fusiforme G11]|uniref:Orotidine 5'-phosphate decarboxylase n=1 Tax=Cronartium quercuum f. sp. fusiforme G11 TaxID=708437 RepID=A0A9P6NP38_9BASI|nr:hypothetical protein CROQUDRAFT_656519 [Cronartium quercuum f. sp. fusiforme G11]